MTDATSGTPPNAPYTLRYLRRGRWRVVSRSTDLDTVLASARGPAESDRRNVGTIAVFAHGKKVWPPKNKDQPITEECTHCDGTGVAQMECSSCGTPLTEGNAVRNPHDYSEALLDICMDCYQQEKDE